MSLTANVPVLPRGARRAAPSLMRRTTSGLGSMGFHASEYIFEDRNRAVSRDLPLLSPLHAVRIKQRARNERQFGVCKNLISLHDLS